MAQPVVQNFDIPGPVLVTPPRFQDARGYFSEVYNQAALAALGIDTVFIQDNQSLSTEAGVIRGLHFQTAPMGQIKLIRVLRGAIFDVAVDIRRDSPSFGRNISVVLTAESGDQLYLPLGFAHGFCTMVRDTEVFYKVSAPYSAAHESGIAWDDPDLGIAWPVSAGTAILSAKDQQQKRLRDL